MIPVKEVGQIHELLINTFGGSHGIRNFASLESALSRPFQTTDLISMQAKMKNMNLS